MSDDSNAAPKLLPCPLLPCPFCGGKPYLEKDYPPDAEGVFYSYKCKTCGAGSREYYAVEACPALYADVRSSWNARAAPDAMLKAERDKSERLRIKEAPMTRLEALQALAEKVEAGASVSWHLYKLAIPEAPDDTYQPLFCRWSMDAVKAVHEAALPDWDVNDVSQAANLAGSPWGVEVAYFDGSRPSNNRKSYSGHNYADPARAWLLAILKALIAQEQAKGDE